MVMVLWHTADGWLAIEHKVGVWWSIARVVGGLAAPLFLFAAGAGAALGARRARPMGDVVRRGISLILIGMALRLVMWGIDSHAYKHTYEWPVLGVGAFALGIAIYALRRAGRTRLMIAGALAMAAYLGVMFSFARSDGIRQLLNFDVLHCIGASTIVVAFVVRALGFAKLPNDAKKFDVAARSMAMFALVVILATLTPTLGELLGAKAGWLAWIARPAPLRPVAAFPLLPWVAYAIAGGVAVLAPRPHAVVLVVIASLVGFVAYEGGYFWSPELLGGVPHIRPFARLAFQASCAIVLALSLSPWCARAPTLITLGRLSLAIYCIHLELAYGAAARPLVRSLDPIDWAIGATLLIALCVIAANCNPLLRLAGIDRTKS